MKWGEMTGKLNELYVMRGAIIKLGEIPFEVLTDFKAQGATYPPGDQDGKVRSTKNIYGGGNDLG